jgi:hypothetical protein
MSGGASGSMQRILEYEKQLIDYLRFLHHTPELHELNTKEEIQTEIKRITTKLNEVLDIKHKTWVVDSSGHLFI